MGILRELGRPDARGLRFEPPGSDDDLVLDAGGLRFEAAALCGRESLIREIERREDVQRLAHPRELLQEPDRQRAEGGRGALLWAHDRNGVFEQTPPLVVVFCDFEGGYQGQGLPALEPVALDGLRQGLLILGLEGAERVSKGGPDPAVVDETLERG